MPEQMSADFEQVMAQCSRGCFTGLLRVRTREGNGEVRFLSGIQDGIRFDSMEGDAALERLLSASEPEFEAISSLPPIDFLSSEPVPPEGGLDRYHAAQLMRYCESNSLTCALELEVEGRVLTARYRLGELLSIEPDSEHTSRLAEAKEGLYRFRLPRFELPANVQQRRSVPAAKAAPAAVAKPVSAAPAAVAKPAPAAVAKPAPFAAKPAATPVAAHLAPAPFASKPAPAAVAKPAPAARPPTAASLAETPLVAMKPVAIVSPMSGSVGTKAAGSIAPQVPAKVPASVPAAPKLAATSPAAESRAAPSPARGPFASVPPVGSASTVRREGPRLGPSAITPQPTRAAERAGTTQPPAAAAKSPTAAQPPAAQSRAPAPRSPVPASRPSLDPQAKPVQLQGLWTDAVKPPPQSTPLELDTALHSKATGGALERPGRTEGLSSIAYNPTVVPAVPSKGRPGTSARYWLLAIGLLLVVALVGWFAFVR
jgi:hypothetical protein